MTTREEIEASASEYRHCYANPTSCDLREFDRCAHTLATSHVKYLAERQRRIEAAGAVIRHLSLAQGFITRLQAEQIITRCLDGATT